MPTTLAIKELLRLIKKKSRKENKENRIFFRRIRRSKPPGLDKSFSQFHDEAFKKISCLDCANCCRTAYPVFNHADIPRVARHFGISKKEFIKKYLVKNIDYDFLTKKTPCPFLEDATNKCTIYEIRPEGCKTYPPAKMRLTSDQLEVIQDNIDVCPAVNEMVSRIKEKYEEQVLANS